MTAKPHADNLHRLVKYALDSGEAKSLDEAKSLFQGYRLALTIHGRESRNSLNQIALLTAVALGRRVFLGGVSVEGDLDVPLKVPLPLRCRLHEAVIDLGGTLTPPADGTPTIVIGGGPRRQRPGFHIRTAVAGWRGGILPAHSKLMPAPGPTVPLAAMLSAGLAVNEAFLFVEGGSPAAGRRPIGFSLWRPTADINWLEPDPSEPQITYLPSRLWLIGLGHLGQAYLWGLGLLPYKEPSSLSIVLQDIDEITPSTESTSILSDAAMAGQKKTRAMATWAERRGFATALQERRFDNSFHRQNEEPAIALCGLDNALGRQALDQVGFDLVVEAGLGRGQQNFRTIRLHVLPEARSAADIWKSATPSETVADRPAYQEMLKSGELDRCGVTLLAGKAVGAPFVGTVAATLALAQVLRLLHGENPYQLIDIDLLSVDQRLAVPNPNSFLSLNPGYTTALY